MSARVSDADGDAPAYRRSPATGYAAVLSAADPSTDWETVARWAIRVREEGLIR